MATDALTFIKAMGFEQVDLFGFSMGGMIAQEIVLMEPRLVRKMIIAGTGPAGGEGISKVARVTYLDMVRGFLTHQDPNSSSSSPGRQVESAPAKNFWRD
jgi:pimeloyl-ACP methyl ester carboxylesterase